MPALIDAINIKRKAVFEHENIPYACLDAEINIPRPRRPNPPDTSQRH